MTPAAVPPAPVPAALLPDGTLLTEHITADRFGASIADGATSDEVAAALAARPDDEGAAWAQADLVTWLADRYGAGWRDHLPPSWTLSLKTAANRLWLGRIYRDRAWRRPHIRAGLSVRHFEAVASIAARDMAAADDLLSQAIARGWTAAELQAVVRNPDEPLPPALDAVDVADLSLPDVLLIAGRRWFADAGWHAVSVDTVAAYNSHILYVADLWREARERRDVA